MPTTGEGIETNVGLDPVDLAGSLGQVRRHEAKVHFVAICGDHVLDPHYIRQPANEFDPSPIGIG